MSVTVVENPISGEHITFRRMVADDGSDCFEADVILAPRGCGPPEHVHPIIEESFKVRSGTLTAMVNGQTRTVTAGEEFTVPPGIPHRWWNDTDETVEIEAIVRPALRLDEFLATVFALAADGKADKRGLPSPLRMSVILPKYWDVLYLAKPPLPVQKVVMAVLSVFARVKGYKSTYP